MGFGQFSYNARPERPTIRRTDSKKRLKHVFENPAHVAFHPLQKDGSGFANTSAWNAQKNWFFESSSDGTRVVFSYRTSYPIASMFQHGKKTVFLLRAGKPWGSTTAGHMSATNAAVPKNTEGVEVFTVPAMVHGCYDHGKPTAAEHNYNLEHYVAEIKSDIEQYLKARSSWNINRWFSAAQHDTAEVKRYARVFKLKLPELPKLPKLDKKKLAAVKERERIRNEKSEAKRKAEREAYERQHAEEVASWKAGPDACKHIGTDGEPKHSYTERWECERLREQEEWEAKRDEIIAAWRAGDPNARLRNTYDLPVMLRVRTFGADESAAGEVGRVETSRGAQVPISHALRGLRFVRAVVARQEAFETNGKTFHLGHYKIDRIDVDGTLTAGCHVVPYSEIERIAPELERFAASEEKQ